MQTTLDCLPCLLKQALYTAQLATDDPAVQKEIMTKVSRVLPKLDFALSPPENAVAIYTMIAEISGCEDPYKDLKENSNTLALRLRPEIQQQITASDDPLLTALRFSIAGNIIDYGAHHDFDFSQTIAECLRTELTIDHYAQLVEDIHFAGNILYLADNCGEVVFDGLVIEQLGKPVTLAVKEKPIINDATSTDARDCGLDQYCQIISNGTNCPGTPLKNCSKEFQEAFKRADLIVSKGQGNFETLSDTQAPLYFLLTIKCPVVARHVAAHGQSTGKSTETGGMIIMKKQ